MLNCTCHNGKKIAILRKEKFQEMQGEIDQSTLVTDHFNLHVLVSR